MGYAFLDFISGTMTPLIPALIGCSMIRGILIFLGQYNLIDTAGSTYMILYAVSNSVFYFLPILVAFSAAQKLDVNPFIAACIAASLMEPNFTSLLTETGNIVSFIGIPVRMFSYTSSLIPALLSTWLYSYLYKFLKKKVPAAIASVVNPTICLIVFVPLTAIVFGPIAYYLGNFIGNAFNVVNGFSPIIAGILVGVLMNYLVMTGLHWVVTALCINEFALNGFSTLFGYWWVACISYIAIALGAIIVAKNKKERSIAVSCSIAAVFGGVSEPTLFTYLLRNKRYAIPMAASGFVGGALAGLLGVKPTAFSMATIFTIPCIEMNGSFVTAAIVFLIEIAIGIVCTVIFVGKSKKYAFEAPVSGEVIPLEKVNDAVFASKSLGNGFAVLPKENKICAPCDGEIISLYPTKHAIGLKTVDNSEILIHIGIDTIELDGKGFTLHVEEGDKVKAGDLLLDFDINYLSDSNLDMTVPVIFTGDKAEIKGIKYGYAAATTTLFHK